MKKTTLGLLFVAVVVVYVTIKFVNKNKQNDD